MRHKAKPKPGWKPTPPRIVRGYPPGADMSNYNTSANQK